MVTRPMVPRSKFHKLSFFDSLLHKSLSGINLGQIHGKTDEHCHSEINNMDMLKCEFCFKRMLKMV